MHLYATVSVKMLHPRNKRTGFILHPYLPITDTSLQQPLSSVPKVVVMERFTCFKFRKMLNSQVYEVLICRDKIKKLDQSAVKDLSEWWTVLNCKLSLTQTQANVTAKSSTESLPMLLYTLLYVRYSMVLYALRYSMYATLRYFMLHYATLRFSMYTILRKLLYATLGYSMLH